MRSKLAKLLVISIFLLSFLRIFAHIISPFSQHFIHFSFTKGIFPESFKLSKVIPIHKKGNKLELNNYRPISILTCFFKVLEILIHNKVLEFLKKHNVIHKTQYGFQKNVSTTHAVLDLVTTSLNNLNKNVSTTHAVLDLVTSSLNNLNKNVSTTHAVLDLVTSSSNNLNKNVSTTYAVLDLVTTSLNNLNKNVYTAHAVLDLVTTSLNNLNKNVFTG